MAAQTSDDDEEIVSINVTPLVDITLVLLIIFMVTANFIVKETIEVDLPRAAHTQDTLKGPLNIVLDKDAKLYLDGTEMSEAELKAKINEQVKQDKDARAVISADQTLNYGKVMHLIDFVKGEGIAKFALNIQKDAAPQAAPAPGGEPPTGGER
ncbi:MAG: biopolymer transporter ExbD [Myxococcaceae bacterium]